MSRFKVYRDVNGYNRLTPEDRIQVIHAYEKTRSYKKLANKFNCSRHQIRCIVVNRDKILSEYYSTLKKPADNHSGKVMSSQYLTLFEKVLYEWFLRAQRHVETGPITNTIFLQKAEEAKLTLGIKDFPTDLVWLMNFRHKHDITDLDMTMLRLGDVEEPSSLEFVDIAAYILEQNVTSGDVILIDVETVSNVGDSNSKFNNCEQSSEIPQPILDCGDNRDIENKISQGLDETVEVFEEVVEPTVIQILDDEHALSYLKPLEDYVLMTSNFRAIGLISQLEQIFCTAKQK